MKKLLLTGITAALFSIAALAQEQDSLRDENNQFRQTEELQQDPAEQAVDSASTEYQQGVNEAEQAGDSLQQESQEIRQDAQDAGEAIEEGAEKTGEAIEEGAERTGDEIKESTEEASDQLQQPAQETPQSEQILDEMNKDSESNVSDSTQQGSANYNMAPELEIIESKEGPNSEVVYKYQDEFFYVDRNEGKMVKVKESELQDAKHEVIVNETEKTNDVDEATNDKAEENKQ